MSYTYFTNFDYNYTLIMKKRSRKEELMEIVTQRLLELDEFLLLPPDRFSDQEFEDLKQEAIKLREMLKFL